MVSRQTRKLDLSDAYCFDGFRPETRKVRGIFGGPKARILPLKRRSKKHAAEDVAQFSEAGMTESASSCGTYPAEIRKSSWKSSSGVWTARCAVR
jgi:hypothetical protein